MQRKIQKETMTLADIKSPADLKKVDLNDLVSLAEEIRQKIIEVTASNGGHIAPSLGAVEIALVLHYVLDMPKDKILWDVGHQAYAHKILTGRNNNFNTLRQLGGISGFPNKDESEYDIFTVGHSSTSISQGLGLAVGRDMAGLDHKVVSVIGDAALASGIALEALNNAGQLNKNITIVLNDNEHSISKSVGALSNYLNTILVNPVYNKVREDMQRLVKSVPIFGFRAFRAARKVEEGVKNLLVPGIFFEELGIRYFGPIDGHDIPLLISTVSKVLKLKGPKLIHVITKKGKGYKYAEETPSDYHGISPFDIETGEAIKREDAKQKLESYTQVFGRTIVSLARKDTKIVCVSAAMRDGTGLAQFAKEFPDRFFDVGIAEEHAVAFAASMAKGGLKPVVAIYSTFLQRAYDQLIHDVALQGLPVIFCVDRAGLVGEDGPTHHGVFDMAYFRHIPNMTVMAPRDGIELEKMLEWAFTHNGPVAIRYPRGNIYSHIPAATFHPLRLGTAETIREGRDIALVAIGSMVSNAVKIADILSENRIEASVINARYVKPLDSVMIEQIASKTKKIVTIEEGVVDGGFGSAVLEFMERENIKGVTVKRIGLPDQFIEHGKREELLKKYHMTADEISQTILKELFNR